MNKAKARKLLLNFVGGAAVGAAAAWLTIRFGPSLDLIDPHWPGLAIAALLLMVGLMVLAGSTSRKLAAGMLDFETDDEEGFRDDRVSLRWQAIVALLAGVELLILSWSTEYFTGATGTALLALLAVILIVQTWLNFRLWRQGDELFRRIIVEAGMGAFLVFQFLLFFWVVGARFGYVADPAALDIYVLLMAVYLLASGVVGTRRGYAAPA